jgi:hypothetical protein
MEVMEAMGARAVSTVAPLGVFAFLSLAVLAQDPLEEQGALVPVDATEALGETAVNRGVRGKLVKKDSVQGEAMEALVVRQGLMDCLVA